ncbi:PSMD14 [Cordylochernes scorpioides]|uniref:PSMD14 n=1 Tax=Cordylochernes scorpioides TaxID=51811 RepID=A0ABY6LIN7_9ARAC|nr:PSMD14 [Cordylochernes scorpioides]
MDRLLRLGGGLSGLGQGPPPSDGPVVDTAEQVYISSLALLKMLKHGRAGVPMEVMGLMLGEFVDDYTVRVIDVFAMPQSGTGVSVEAVDPVFQAKMLDMLKQTGRPEMVVGWYHSHPGFGCWLSGVDINTQQSFEALSERAVAVVVDPIQSVKGKVVIDAFRLINANMMVLGQEPRQTTSNLGHLNKPSIQALIHGLNRHYYSISINYRKNELEQKMLKHGRAGVPMEVMGLMLGEFVDDYTVRVIDVFAMPQSGTGVSVEAVDPVFQAKMLDMLKQTGRPEMVVGWYHSHPGFGCWLSGVDINTQQSFEALSERAVAVVVDPIQSVKGKVVIDAFRLINANMMVLGQEPRQTTSNLGHLNKPSIQALIHGLNRHYYSISINYRKNELEQKMLLNLHKKSWMEGLGLQDYTDHCAMNAKTVGEMLELARAYHRSLEEEERLTPEQLAIKHVGRQDPKRHLEEHVDVLMTSNIVQCLGAMLDTVVFK